MSRAALQAEKFIPGGLGVQVQSLIQYVHADAPARGHARSRRMCSCPQEQLDLPRVQGHIHCLGGVECSPDKTRGCDMCRCTKLGSVLGSPNDDVRTALPPK